MNNYAFWMRRMCAFICSIDDSVWTSVEEEWETPDKALKDKFNVNNKALNEIFCGIASNEFHGIFHANTKKVKELQMLTTCLILAASPGKFVSRIQLAK